MYINVVEVHALQDTFMEQNSLDLQTNKQTNKNRPTKRKETNKTTSKKDNVPKTINKSEESLPSVRNEIIIRSIAWASFLIEGILS